MNVKKLFVAVLLITMLATACAPAQPAATMAPAKPFRIAVIMPSASKTSA